jgi:membrane fusion protein, heavy metal efflux system
MKRWMSSIAVVLGLTAVSGGGYIAMQRLGGSMHHKDADAKPTDSAEKKEAVFLTESKQKAAGIRIEAVQLRPMQPTRTVPGRIEYNGLRHVAVKSPADGLVRKMEVIVGKHVDAGQLLAIVDSPELGERRADVLNQKSELELARHDRDWWRDIQTNLNELLARLKRPQEIAVLEKEFSDKTLGDYRRDIFSAYSSYRTAETISTGLKTLATGAVSQRMVLEQTAARDSAAATFQAACEQAAFDVKQKVGKAEAVYDDAARRLAVAGQRLTWLTGQSAEQIGDLAKDESLSTWPVKAPFAATVEEILLAASERVRQGEEIMILADTTRLWVQADIRDRDWSALTLSAGQAIKVQTPALPGKTLEAKIAFIGRTVNPETRAAPLVADIPNDDRVLRPGMFVRVLLPDGEPRESLAIPVSALVRHEGRTFVFVPVGSREFRVREVTVGLTMEPWIEVTSGLGAGDRIVVSGTFQLKSELLLEPED